MIAFGSAVSDREVYERVALPGIRRVAEPDSVIWTKEGYDSIQVPYNEMLEEAAGIEELEAVVLLHEDLELTDDSLLGRVRPLLGESRVGLIGALGVRGLEPHRWTTSQDLYGTSMAPGVQALHSAGAYEVEMVDGALLVIAPWAVRALRFDERLADGFDGYDVDFALRVRALGGRVVCYDIPCFHHMTRSWSDHMRFIRASAALARMWDPARRKPEWA